MLTFNETTVSDAVAQALVGELQASFIPIAATLGCSLAFRIDSRDEWLVIDPACRCDDEYSVGDLDCLGAGRDLATIPIEFEGTWLGDIRVCTPRAAATTLGVLRQIIESTLKRILLEKQESRLRNELSECRQNLEALYETHSLTPTSQSMEAIVDRVLSRAVGGEHDRRAALWVEHNGTLEQFGTEASGNGSRPPFDEGLIRTAVAEQRGLVIDDLQPECGGSARVLIAPVASFHGTRGAVAVWGSASGKPFDSRFVRQTQALATQGVMALEGERLYRAALENELIRQELDIGARMQQMLLIGNQPNPLGFAHVASLVLPSQRVGGDFVEFFPHQDHCIDILIGDVMGKGLKASLVGAAVARQFHRTLCSLLSARQDHLPRPEKIVSIVHEEIARLLAEFDSFVTLNYARIDATTTRFEFVDCGHTPILHHRRQTRQCQPIRGQSMPLGFSDRESYEQVSVLYDDGDLFVFYSDGVTEVRDANGEFFGLERLIALVEGPGHDGNPEALIQIIQTALAHFAGSDRFDDDLTIVVVEAHVAEPPKPGTRTACLEIKSDLSRLEAVRSFVRSVCQGDDYPCLSARRVSLLELAVTEAISNIMIHAYGGRTDCWIRVEGEISNECVLIRCTHTGEPFDPSTVEPPPFDGTREGGYGVYLIDQSVDEVFYVQNGRGIHAITLIQKRQLTEPGA